MASEKRKAYLEENADRIRAQRDEYRKRNSVNLRSRGREYMREVFASWGSMSRSPMDGVRLGRVAELVCIKLLEHQGYESIIHVSDLYQRFPAVDILAKKDGFIHAFQVTAGLQKIVPKRARSLIIWMGWKFHVVFIRPTLADYWECIPNLEKANSARVPIEVITSGGLIIPELCRRV